MKSIVTLTFLILHLQSLVTIYDPVKESKQKKPSIKKPCNIRCAKGYHITKECKCKLNKPKSTTPCPPGFEPKPPSSTCVPKSTSKPKNDRKCLIKSCFPGYKINQKCKCVPISLIVCLKLCPKGQHIRPGSCICEPKRNCLIKKCKSGSSLDKSKCACVLDNSSANQCNIQRCDHRYRINQKKCICEPKPGPICKIGCPHGMRVFPGKCRCVYPPVCPITNCRKGFNLNVRICKCVKHNNQQNYPFYPGYDYYSNGPDWGYYPYQHFGGSRYGRSFPYDNYYGYPRGY